MSKDYRAFFEFERLFNAYPIVDTSPMPNLTLKRAKMVLVANMIGKTVSNISSKKALEAMCDICELSIDALPDLATACKNSGVSYSFINDYNKVQYMFEYNQQSMLALPTSLERYLCTHKK